MGKPMSANRSYFAFCLKDKFQSSNVKSSSNDRISKQFNYLTFGFCHLDFKQNAKSIPAEAKLHSKRRKIKKSAQAQIAQVAASEKARA